jgi:hypothetical protein
MCPVLDALTRAVAAVPALPSPTGLGAADVLTTHVAVLAGAVTVLQRELALRMAALQSQAPAADVRGDAVRAGLPGHQGAALRRTGVFAADHPALAAAWRAGTATAEQVAIVQAAAARLPERSLEADLVAAVLPHLPALDPAATRRLAAHAADLLAPGDPDHAERTDHDARHLSWATTPGGGITLTGYLPPADADAFTAAITALAEDLRAAGDQLTPAQRRADALTALTARATSHGLPTGGGLPATLTLTIALADATRIAATTPGHRGGTRPRSTATLGTRNRDTRPAGDAAVRFGLCCAAITPLLHATPPPAAPGSLLAAIAATPAEPLALGRAVRLATPAQRRALQHRDHGCVIPGCTITAAYTQPHHVTAWAIDGPTDLHNLVSLCHVHHRQTELGRWTFTPARPGTTPPPGTHPHAHWWITANPWN